MNKKLNTTIDFEFCDGTTEEMTLTFYALYQLKAKNKFLYERYTKIMSKGNITDELDMVTLMYTAYICANLADYDNVMTEEEFMIKCGSDRRALMNAYQALTQPKKQSASESRS